MPHDTEFENNPSGMVRRWRAELQAANKAERDWREQARKVIERYRDDDRNRRDRRYNILWANTETLRPQMYSATPEPVVRRRFHDQDPIGKQVAEILERSLEYSIDAYDFDGTIDHCITDYLLPGRAIARVRYIPTFESGEAPMLTVQPRIQEDGSVLYFNGEDQVDNEAVLEDDDGSAYMLGEAEEEVTYEEVRCEYVNWEDFRMSPARTWGEVRWVAFRHRMTRSEMVEAFGAKGRSVPLTIASQETATESDDNSDTQHISRRAEVWEIWNRENREVIFTAEGKDDAPIDVRSDPLNLEDFFPCPEPLYSVSTNNTMVPIPEYTLYQDQATELNRITTRIDRLVEALKARGLYAGEHKAALDQLMNGDDNELIPVEDFAALQDGTLESRIAWMPIEQVAKTLQWLYEQRSQLLQAIYQITGIADIMRGATDAREGVGTQELKGQFGVMRLQPRQKAVQQFVRDLLELKAEVMAEMFEPQTLQLMTGTQMPDQVLSIMRQDALRGFRVDIETDSTIAEDAQTDKREIAAAFSAMSSFAQHLSPLVQSGYFPPQAIKEVFLWGMRRFRVSRQVEDALQAEPQPQGPEQPDPLEVAKLQQQERQSQRSFQLELLKLKKEYAEIDSEELRTVLQQSVDLVGEQEQSFRDAFSKLADALQQQEREQARARAAQGGPMGGMGQSGPQSGPTPGQGNAGPRGPV